MKSEQTVYDAWVVGEHDLPLDRPVLFSYPSEGNVLVHTRRKNGGWFVMSVEDFNAEYEWINE